MTNFSALPNPFYPQFKFLNSDTTIYIGATGNDLNSGLTPLAPVATLKKAWDIISTYTIVGNAKVYIQFQKGVYNVTSPNTFFPENLYHPQGENITIQGDPSAFKQQYLTTVKDYTFDMSKWGHWGHTGTVNLWGRTAAPNAAASGSGSRNHGYTAEDLGTYVAISNAAFGAEYHYYDYQNSLYTYNYSTVGLIPRYRSGSTDVANHMQAFNSYPDMWYGHGTSADDGFGIVGLARIVEATADSVNLGLAFKNINRDTRSSAVSLPDDSAGKVGNSTQTYSLHGVASGYPQSQLHFPNGYYGATGNITPIGYNNNNYVMAGWPAAYPSAATAGVSNVITTDPYLVSNYPVVLKITGNHNTRPAISLKNCRLGGLINLCFVNGSWEGTSAGSMSLSRGLNDYIGPMGYWHNATPPVIAMENSELDIRHIGINAMTGYGSCIDIRNSKLGVWSKYPEQSISLASANSYDLVNNAGHASMVYARTGSLENAPVLMVNALGAGIYSYNSDITLSASPGGGAGWSNAGWRDRFRYTDSTVWIQSMNNAITLTHTSKLHLLSGIFIRSDLWPSIRIQMMIPAALGLLDASGSGGTYGTGIWNPNGTNMPRSIIMTAKTPTSVGNGLTLARMQYPYFANSTNYWNHSNQKMGLTGPDAWRYFINGVDVTSTVQNPTQTVRYVYLNGTRVGDPSLALHVNDYYSLMNGASGCTLCFYSFADDAETQQNVQSFQVSKNNARFVTGSGVTLDIRSAGANTAGVSADYYGILYYYMGSQASGNVRADSTYCINDEQRQSLIVLTESSSLHYGRNMLLSGGQHGLFVGRESTVAPNSNIVGSGLAYGSAYGSYYPLTVILAEQQGSSVICSQEDSSVTVGALFTKNPPILPHWTSTCTGVGAVSYAVLKARSGGKINIIDTCVLVTPTRTIVPALQTPNGYKPGFGTDNNASTTTPTTSVKLYENVTAVHCEDGGVVNGAVKKAGAFTLPQKEIISDGSVYATPEQNDANVTVITTNSGGVVSGFDTVPSSAITNNTTLKSSWNVWSTTGSGTNRRIQTQETDKNKRFTNQSLSDPMFRFWLQNMGWSGGGNFWNIPIMTTASESYGTSATIAVDAGTTAARTATSYGKLVLEPILSANTVLAQKLVNNTSNTGWFSTYPWVR